MNLKHITTLFSLNLLGLTLAHAAPPPNDSAAKPHVFKTNYQKLTGQDLSQATAAATDPLVNGQPAGKTLWYKYPASLVTFQGYWELRLKSSTATGQACFYYVQDEDNPLTSLVRAGNPFTITPGQTVALPHYLTPRSAMLMVSGLGSFDLAHYQRAYNDFIPFATTLSGNRGTQEGYNTYATVSADEPAPESVSGFKNTVWYKWTPSFTGAAAVDTNFSTITAEQDRLIHEGAYDDDIHQTVLFVYQGAPEALNLVGWDRNGGWSQNSRVAFNATAGTTYHIAVSTLYYEAPGGFQLNYYQANTAGEFYAPYSPTNNNTQVRENVGPTHVPIRRRYASSAATVKLATVAGGTATSGSDYQALNTTLTFPAPDPYDDESWEVEADLAIINDSATESGSEWIKLELSNPSAGATLRQYNSTASVVIVDDETVETSYSTYLQHETLRVKEDAGDINNTLHRLTSAGFEGIQVIQTPASGTATHYQDFRVSFAFLEPNAPMVNVPLTIYNDTTFEEDEEITIYVTPGHQYKLIIEDDDAWVPLAGQLTAGLNYGGGEFYNSGARLGQLFATLTSSGALSGKFITAGETVVLKTQLDWRGKAIIPIALKNRAAMILTIQAMDSEGGFRLKLLDGALNRTFETTAVMQNYAAKTNPCPETGRYTLAGGVFNSQTKYVACATAGTIVVNDKGNAVIAGRLFDGTAYTAAGYIDGQGWISAMVPMYAKAGCLGFRGELPLSDGQYGSVNINVNRPARAGDSTKTEAIAEATTAYACRYTPPAKGEPALMSWAGGAGKATLPQGGPLANAIEKALTISLAHVIKAPVDAHKLTLKLTPTTGIFTGSFIPPGATKPLTIFGALNDVPTMNSHGRGFFFDGLKGGTITIGKP